MLAILLAVACKPDCPDGYDQDGALCLQQAPEPAVCDEGYELRFGVCYEVASEPTAEDTLTAGWPECRPVEGEGELDLVAGCASGVCIGMQYADAVEAAGEPECELDGDGWDFCYWSNGVGSYLYDTDEDGTPDADFEIYELILYLDYRGLTSDGLGLDTSLACWRDVLGEPDSMSIDNVSGDWAPRSLYYRAYYLTVWDYLDENLDVGHDGYADYLYLD